MLFPSVCKKTNQLPYDLLLKTIARWGEVGRKVLQESGSIFSLMSPWNQKKTPWPFLCKQVNQACHHCLHGKQHIQRLQQRDMRMAQWYRQFAGKQQTWSLVSLTQRDPSEMQRPVGGKAQQQQVWCDLGVVRPYVTVRLSLARVLRIDDSTHPLARRAARPDCDGTCQCC